MTYKFLSGTLSDKLGKFNERNDKMKMKFMSWCLVFSILLACNGQICFASDTSIGIIQNKAGIAHQLERIKDRVGTKNTVQNYFESKNEYQANLKGLNVRIGKSGEKEVKLGFKGNREHLNMSLPEKIKKAKAIKNDDGTILYDDRKGNASVAVQVIEEDKGKNIVSSGTRTMILIKNSSADKSYKFRYNIAKGCKLIFANQCKNVDENDKGDVYIVKSNTEVIGVIKAPWAKDADGNNLNTHYKIKGNALIQYIDFNKNTKFPVVADPTTIVDSKTIVKKTYSKWLKAYPPGQGAYGTKTSKRKHIIKGIYWGRTKTFRVESGISGKRINLTVGYVVSASSGVSLSIKLPSTGHWYKVVYYAKWRLRYKGFLYKYRTIRITNNGKTKKVTYKWVEVSNWVSKVRLLGDTIDYVKTRN